MQLSPKLAWNLYSQSLQLTEDEETLTLTDPQTGDTWRAPKQNRGLALATLWRFAGNAFLARTR